MTSLEQKSFGLTKTIRRRRSTGSEIAEEWSINIEYLEMLKSLESNMEKRDLSDNNEVRQSIRLWRSNFNGNLESRDKINCKKKWNENIDPGDNEGGNAEDIAPHTYWRRSNAETSKRKDILDKMEKGLKEDCKICAKNKTAKAYGHNEVSYKMFSRIFYLDNNEN